MGYDQDDSFPFDFEQNGIPFGSKLNGKLSPHHIQFNVKENRNIVFSVYRKTSAVTSTDRETSVSQHNGAQLRGPLKALSIIVM